MMEHRNIQSENNNGFLAIAVMRVQLHCVNIAIWNANRRRLWIKSWSRFTLTSANLTRPMVNTECVADLHRQHRPRSEKWIKGESGNIFIDKFRQSLRNAGAMCVTLTVFNIGIAVLIMTK